MFGNNALEDDDLKQGLSPVLKKEQKLFENNNNHNDTTMISSNLNISGND